ncbi:hypothetical protein HK098_000980 [Nowakowskiella sp. JEL0407]|nr:hypothetical protein HK098_000980 [Nowakowskiella sp. JEL0407]
MVSQLLPHENISEKKNTLFLGIAFQSFLNFSVFICDPLIFALWENLKRRITPTSKNDMMKRDSPILNCAEPDLDADKNSTMGREQSVNNGDT